MMHPLCLSCAFCFLLADSDITTSSNLFSLDIVFFCLPFNLFYFYLGRQTNWDKAGVVVKVGQASFVNATTVKVVVASTLWL
jgi:hypothetical protein